MLQNQFSAPANLHKPLRDGALADIGTRSPVKRDLFKTRRCQQGFRSLTRVSPKSADSVAHEIMTVGEVADYLEVTERTIYRLAAANKMPAFKVGGSWRFSKADIEAWIRNQNALKNAD